jgi:hypothetical protein
MAELYIKPVIPLVLQHHNTRVRIPIILPLREVGIFVFVEQKKKTF